MLLNAQVAQTTKLICVLKNEGQYISFLQLKVFSTTENVLLFSQQLTGDLSFASGSVAILMNECGNLAAINTSQSSNGSGDENYISVEEISELLCPNDCTFNGKCINGSCVCNKDYTAEDCSVSIYQKPTISRSVSMENKIPGFFIIYFIYLLLLLFFKVNTFIFFLAKDILVCTVLIIIYFKPY